MQWCMRDTPDNGEWEYTRGSVTSSRQLLPAYHVPHAADNLRSHPPLESKCWRRRERFEPWGFTVLPHGRFEVDKITTAHQKLHFVFPGGPLYGAKYVRIEINRQPHPHYMVRAGLLLDTGVHRARLHYADDDGAKTEGMLDDKRARATYTGLYYISYSHITMVCPPGAKVLGVVTQALDSRQYRWDEVSPTDKTRQKWSFTVTFSTHGPDDKGARDMPTFAPHQQNDTATKPDEEPEEVTSAKALLDFFRWLPGLRKQIGGMMLRYYNPPMAASFADIQAKFQAQMAARESAQSTKTKQKRKRHRKKNTKKATSSSSPVVPVDSVHKTDNPSVSVKDAKVASGGDAGVDTKADAVKTIRKLRKKLRQIQRLIEMKAAGKPISAQQQSKIDTFHEVHAALDELSSLETQS